MRPSVRSIATSAGLGLLLAACGEPAADVEQADLEVSAPGDGAEVAQPFDIELTVTGAELGRVADGLHHLHVYLGDDYEMHFSDDPFTVDGLEEGGHTIRVVLARANHDELDVEDTVTLVVTGAPAADDEDDEDDGPGYDY
jgi:hypothetical protein